MEQVSFLRCEEEKHPINKSQELFVVSLWCQGPAIQTGAEVLVLWMLQKSIAKLE